MTDANNKPLRIVYMGTPDFAVPALNALASSRDNVVGVVTQPDKRRGRGKKMQHTAVKDAALKASIPVFQPENINTSEAIAHLSAWEPDVTVVAAFGQILKPEVLDIPRYGSLNIHASLLPKYRGAAPINWAIANGEEDTGVTIMQMDVGLDTGPMILKKKTLIGPLETAGELHDRLAMMGAEIIVDVMRLIHLDSINAVEQDDQRSTYASMLSKKDGAIDWTQSAQDIANRIRGFNPWPGTYSYFTPRGDEAERERIKFHLARPVVPEEVQPEVDDVPPGTVIRADRVAGELRITTGEGVLNCLKVQAPGRRAMDVADFLNGHDIAVGDRFESPAKTTS